MINSYKKFHIPESFSETITIHSEMLNRELNSTVKRTIKDNFGLNQFRVEHVYDSNSGKFRIYGEKNYKNEPIYLFTFLDYKTLDKFSSTSTSTDEFYKKITQRIREAFKKQLHEMKEIIDSEVDKVQ